MKRYAHPSPPLHRRRLKSVKLSNDPLEEQQISVPRWNGRLSDEDEGRPARASRLCDEYNVFLTFGETHARNDSSSAVARHGFSFQNAVHQTKEVLREAKMKYEMKCNELEQHLDDFIIASLNSPYAAADGDLLRLDYSHLKDALSRLRVDDHSAFGDRVVELISAAATQEPTMEEKSGLNPPHPWEKQYFCLEKVLLLTQYLIDRGQYDKVFHALVALKSLYRHSNPRFNHHRAYVSHSRIDRLIKAFVAGEVPSNANHESHVHNRWFSTAGEPDTVMYTFNVDGAKWVAGHLDRVAGHWKLSQAVRVLRWAYFDEDASDADGQCDWGCCTLQQEKCFHKNSLHMLTWLQVKAWSEVRANVMLTIGTLLPAELTERVFEYALVAEEVPEEPSVWEPFIDEEATEVLEYASDVLEQHTPDSFPSMKIKEAYWCSKRRQMKDGHTPSFCPVQGLHDFDEDVDYTNEVDDVDSDEYEFATYPSEPDVGLG